MRDITIIIPTYNEEKILLNHLTKIKTGISREFPNRCEFVIADSDSKDTTPSIAKKFCELNNNFSYINTGFKGKGEKIKDMALRAKTPYCGWIDSDLPLTISEYCSLIRKVVFENADIAISSRYVPGAKIQRNFLRLLLSRSFHFAVKAILLIDVSETTSGAKFWNSSIKKKIWPKVKGKRWFFDTELVYYSIKNGYNLVEVPITYKDRKDSKFSSIKEWFKISAELISFRIRTIGEK